MYNVEAGLPNGKFSDENHIDYFLIPVGTQFSNGQNKIRKRKEQKLIKLMSMFLVILSISLVCSGLRLVVASRMATLLGKS